jgi:ppGpp synthetase/RelA/SpoT-type nucleotidyltranferase
MFTFIDEVTSDLEEWTDELELDSRFLSLYFEEIFQNNEDSGYINISSRVKKAASVKEKIVRNNFYKTCSNSEEFFSELHDLIGIRIECRFSEDEKKIYKILRGYFDQKDENELYYNEAQKNVKLKLAYKQPEKQKNGLKIFRIDGIYEAGGKNVNFELQIKSLVNIFWSEIEHKIIYKNYNYMLIEGFFKDMLNGIKENLQMIDNQLLSTYKQFNRFTAIDGKNKSVQIESLLTKVIYDVFKVKIKEDLGFYMDFRQSCDLIVDFLVGTNYDSQNYNNIFIKVVDRLNAVGFKEMKFDTELYLETDVTFQNEFSKIIGERILKSINADLQWNVFFRILFAIEAGNNTQDFEKFIIYIDELFSKNKCFNGLKDIEYGQAVKEAVLLEIANLFNDMGTIDFIYRDKIKTTFNDIEYFIEFISENIHTKDEWETKKEKAMELLRTKLKSNFESKLLRIKYLQLLDELKSK